MVERALPTSVGKGWARPLEGRQWRGGGKEPLGCRLESLQQDNIAEAVPREQQSEPSLGDPQVLTWIRKAEGFSFGGFGAEKRGFSLS